MTTTQKLPPARLDYEASIPHIVSPVKHPMPTPINWKEIAEKWQSVADRNKAVLSELLSQYDEETGTIDVLPIPSCPLCTKGTTPVALDKGPCAYHQALAICSQTTDTP